MRLGDFMLRPVLLLLLACFLLLTLIAQPLLGFSPWQLPAALRTATALSAKLACSGYFLSDQSLEQLADDIASYSPATRLVELSLSDDTVTATLGSSLYPAQARFKDNQGCTLVSQKPDAPAHQQLALNDIPTTSSLWPAGETTLIDPFWQEQLEQVFTDDNQQHLNTRALLWIQDGELQAEVYADGVTPQTPLLGWSMAKSLSGIWEGRIEAMGLASAQNHALFPQWQDDARREITLSDLLQMTSGLDFNEAYTPGSDATEMLFFAHQAAGIPLAQTPDHPRGEHFAYSSGSSNLLSYYLSELLGGPQQAADFLQRELLGPLAMANTVLETDPAGYLVGSSYVYASGRDWARLGQLLLNQGELNGQRLLSQEWVKRATTPNVSDNDPRYGYQLWLNGPGELRWPALPADAFAMRGNRKQLVMVLPSHNAVFVRLGWTKGHYPFEQHIANLLAKAEQGTQ